MVLQNYAPFYYGVVFNNLFEAIISFFFMTSLAFSYVANDCIFLMFHLSCYSIAYYIQLLRLKFSSCNSKGVSLRLEGSKKVLLHLYEASRALETVFSLPVLYVITTKLVIVSTNFFCIIYGLIKPNSGFPVDWTLHSIVQVITNLAHLLIVVHSADLPVYQVCRIVPFLNLPANILKKNTNPMI